MTRSLRLLRIISTLNPEYGGPVEALCRLTPHLGSLGVSTTVATLDRPDAPWVQQQSFPAIGLGPGATGYGFRFGLPAAIYRLAREHDVVIIHGLWQYHSYATWRALHGTGIHYFVYPHGMLDPWFKHTYPLKHYKKLAYWLWAEHHVLRDARAVLFTTEEERLRARQSFSLYQAHEKVVHYGTSAPPDDPIGQREAFFDAFPRLRGQRIFLFLSRIHPKKGLDLLIEAFALVANSDPTLHLVIAGPGEIGYKARLQQRSLALGIPERLTWTGMLTGNLKWGAYRAAELFCLPSHQENFGVAVAEALACGLPVAIAETVNISSDVAFADAGLVHADTLAGTSHALQKWLLADAVKRMFMATKAISLFRQKYEVSSVAKSLLEVLGESSCITCSKQRQGMESMHTHSLFN